MLRCKKLINLQQKQLRTNSPTLYFVPLRNFCLRKAWNVNWTWMDIFGDMQLGENLPPRPSCTKKWLLARFLRCRIPKWSWWINLAIYNWNRTFLQCPSLILSSNILYVHLKLYVAVTHSLEEIEVERDGSVKTCLVIGSMEYICLGSACSKLVININPEGWRMSRP